MGNTASLHLAPNNIKTRGWQNTKQKTLIGTSIAFEKAIAL
jgi:hypothetical protein